MRLEAEARVEELEGQGQENKDKLTAANARVSELMIKFNSVKQKEDFIVENIRRINMDIENTRKNLMALQAAWSHHSVRSQSWKTG